jgi:hypothetical protein
MAMSEIEALMQGADFRVREVLIRLLGHKRRIREELDGPGLPVLREQRLRGALAEIDGQIQGYRFSGWF